MYQVRILLLGDELDVDTTELLITVQKQKTAATVDEEQMVQYPGVHYPCMSTHTHSQESDHGDKAMTLSGDGSCPFG